ncbi:sconC, partial [Symbiodinium sp. KB8]
HSEELSVHPMTLLVCGKIATLIKAMSMEEYKEAFRLEKDFTPEEEAKIRADNAWAES